MKLKLNLLFLFLFVLLKTFAQEEIPFLKEYVTDKAKVLSHNQFTELEERLKAYESVTTNQIVVCVVDELANTTIEEYAYKIFEKNKVGLEKIDNGVLLLISKKDRKLRIEVGFGFEHILTDVKCSRIIRQIITPNFKKEDYFKGISLGITEIIATINNTSTLSEANSIEEENKQRAHIDNVFEIIELVFKIILYLIGLFIAVFFIVRNYKDIPRCYLDLINLFRGVIVGKIKVSKFLQLLLVYVATLGVISFMIVLFIVLIYLGLIYLFDIKEQSSDWFYKINISNETFYNVIFLLLILYVLIPFLIAFFNRKHIKGLAIGFSFDKTDENYLKQYLIKYKKIYSTKGYSSSGSSSYSSLSSSSSSSNSFSGKGGSSGGGGASGSW